MTDPFYTGQRWRDLRKRVLAKARYTDQLRLREGVRVEANTVHHIFPRELYPEHQYASWNLIAVSGQTHRALHTPFGDLSPTGWKLLEETAERRGIPVCWVTLIIGMPNSGKTTVAKQILRGGLAYDLDYIAAAFRLRSPHEERHQGSRRMANALLKGFLANVRRYTGRVVVIRSAPTVEELIEIEPDELICCLSPLNGSYRRDTAIDGETLNEMQKRVCEAVAWAKANNIRVEER